MSDPVQTISVETHVPRFCAETLVSHLEEMELAFKLYHHEPVFTVAEANKVDAQIPGLHTRNMFLKDKKGQMALVTLSHDTPIDLKKLSVLLDMKRFSFGSPDRLWVQLGVRPGSVTPLSILNNEARDIRMVLERKMMEAETINVHPLDNAMTIGFSPQSLLDVLEKHEIGFEIIDLSPAAP